MSYRRNNLFGSVSVSMLCKYVCMTGFRYIAGKIEMLQVVANPVDALING